MHGTGQCKVGFDRVLQLVEQRALAAPPQLELRVVHDFVQDGEPVARRRLRIGSVCPEFGEAPRVVSTGYHLRLVGFPGVGIDGVARVDAAAFEEVIVFLKVSHIGGKAAVAAHVARRNVPHNAIRGVEVGGPNGNHGKIPFPRVVHTARNAG